MNRAIVFVDQLRDEIREPVSHGSPVEGSIVRLGVLLVIALYTWGMLRFGFVADPIRRQAAEQLLFHYLPPLFAIAGAYFVYMWQWPPDHSVLRVTGAALFDSCAAAACVAAGHAFAPFLALFPWFSLVYGVRFGAAWLELSAGVSLVCLGYLLHVADTHGLDAVLISSTVVTLLVVAAYSRRLVRRVGETQKQLVVMATCDPLTGLPNRRLLHDRLTQALVRTQRSGRDVAVLFFDLDGFKHVNDTLGHAVGDELLIRVAREVRARLRGSDTLARIAGDEFVVVLEDLHSPENARRVAQTILATVRGIDRLGDHSLQISASIGMAAASFDARFRTDPYALIDAADHAMYQAKRSGKNGIWVHGQTMRADPPPVARIADSA